MYKMVRCDISVFVLRGSYSIRVSQGVLTNEFLRYLCPNMINFDAEDFSERRSEEVISSFWRSV